MISSCLSFWKFLSPTSASLVLTTEADVHYQYYQLEAHLHPASSLSEIFAILIAVLSHQGESQSRVEYIVSNQVIILVRSPKVHTFASRPNSTYKGKSIRIYFSIIQCEPMIHSIAIMAL